MRMLWLGALLGLATACNPDSDGDGVTADFDCDDDDPEVYPDATEYCDDIDNNCDGTIDEPRAIDSTAWYVDSDGDGYGDPERLTKACDPTPGWVANGEDCDDTDPDVVPPC